MHVVYMLFEMDFQNKVMWQKPLKRDRNHSHHVEFEELENLFVIFSLGEKRVAAICFFVRLCIEPLSKLSYTLTCPG